jgi:hypothetical protein
MGFINDLRAIGVLLTVQLVGFLAWAMALLGPVFAVLPIPHNPHEWGIALASGVVYLKVRHKERKRRAARRVPPPPAPAREEVWPGPKAAKRRARPAGEKTAKTLKKATP